ncbi:MAG TPA: IS200/IS605 family transposase [Chloroflexota bacterium]|nr:IS200/IS605 family transposase [Chloroflexota bacterium]
MSIQNYSIHHRLTYHFVWSPMRLKACLCGAASERLEQLIREKIEELEIELHDYRILPDRVYISVSAPPTLAPHRIACQIKAHTSHVLRSEFKEMTRIPTLWTRTYAVFGGEQVTPEEALAEFEALLPPRRPRGRPRKQNSEPR